MGFLERVYGIFFNPKSTFKGVVEKPVWIDALILILVFLMVFSYLTSPYKTKDTLELMRNNVKLREKMGEEGFNRMIKSLENPSQRRRVLGALVQTPIFAIIGFLISSGIIFGISRLFSTEGKFKEVLSIYLHGNFVDKIFGNVLKYFLIISKKSVFQVTTSLALFFPKLEFTSPAYIILAHFDFFQIWMFGILAYGLSYSLKISFKKSLIISYGFFLLKSLIYIILGLISMKFYG